MTHTHVTAPTQYVDGNRNRFAYRRLLGFSLGGFVAQVVADSGHGALFQYADAFVREGLQFLTA
jgi:hypothetical protein